MEFLEGFLVTDIYWVSDYRSPRILLLQLFHKLHGLGHDDSAKSPVKILSILNSYCKMRLTPIRFFSTGCSAPWIRKTEEKTNTTRSAVLGFVEDPVGYKIELIERDLWKS